MAWLKRGAKRPGPVRGGRARPGEGPVDLGAELAALCSPGAAAGRALAEVRALAARTRDPAALALLRVLERGAESGQLALPPLPEVVLRVRALVEQPDLRIADLERETFYGAAKPATSIGEAVVRVGLRQTRHLVLALALRSRVLRVPGHDDEVGELWVHALAASLCSQSIAALLGGDPDEASLLGLVHDVGRVAVLAALAEVERGSRGQQRVTPEALDALSDSLHCALGAMLADAWSLSPAVVAAISHHHAPEAAPESVQELARIACAGDRLAHALIGTGPGSELPAIGGIDPELVRAALDEARESYGELSKVV
jgi:HD-like signal output (HDOD) protein